MSKTCARCREVHPIESFCKNSQNSSGVHSYCRGCRKRIAHDKYERSGRLSMQVKYVQDLGSPYFKEHKRALYEDVRRSVIAHYSAGANKCACCGEGTYEFLAIDHVHGGGVKHQKRVGGGSRLTGWIVKNGLPPGFRVLCHNCNVSRGVNGYCPHEGSLT